MKIGVLSISYKDTPIVVREKVKFSRKNYESAYKLLNKSSFLTESVILSTCNRTEIYFAFTKNKFEKALSEIEDILLKVFNLKNDYLKDYLSCKRGFKAVKYLFEIATGLHSQVLGEQQILGQVKDAQELAIEFKGSGKYLNRIFREAITTAKKIRDKTGLSDKNLSISSVAVNFIENKFSNLSGKKVLIVGVGEVSRIVLELLQDKGIEKMFATNRTHGKVVDIAEYYQGITAVKYSQLEKMAAGVDIVISSTAAPHYILHTEEFQKHYNKKDLSIIDLGVPRDIEPDIGKWPGVTLINMDMLTEKLEENKEHRISEIDKAENLIKEGLGELEEWFCWQKIVPIIKKIKNCNREIITREFKKLEKNLEIEPKTSKEIENFAEHLGKKLFNRIILNLKDIARKEDDYMGIVDRLFSEPN